MEPILAELRAAFDAPEAFKHLEKVIMDMPNGKEKLVKTQEWLCKIRDQMAAAQAAGGATA